MWAIKLQVTSIPSRSRAWTIWIEQSGGRVCVRGIFACSWRCDALAEHETERNTRKNRTHEGKGLIDVSLLSCGGRWGCTLTLPSKGLILAVHSSLLALHFIDQWWWAPISFLYKRILISSMLKKIFKVGIMDEFNISNVSKSGNYRPRFSVTK